MDEVSLKKITHASAIIITLALLGMTFNRTQDGFDLNGDTSILNESFIKLIKEYKPAIIELLDNKNKELILMLSGVV